MATAWCVKCKKKVEIKNPKEAVSVKGVKMVKGICSFCSTNVCLMGGIK
jgi:hypothetical protein